MDEVRKSGNTSIFDQTESVAVPATRAPEDGSMFGKKKAKQQRLEKIAETIRETSPTGISQANLAQKVGVTRGTITKDMGVVEQATGAMFYEDDGKLHWFGESEQSDEENSDA